MECTGLIHLYCGDGKGKTTAAMGLILRALGRQKRVLLVQLMKSQETGELLILNKLENLKILRGKSGVGFSFSMTSEQKDETRKICDNNLKIARDEMICGNCDMLVIDEAAGAIARELACEDIFRQILECRPKNVELVFTGRKMPRFLIDAADYITEMNAIKHPYSKGICAREGIEF